MELVELLKIAVERKASDLHIKAGDVFRARIDGKLVPLTKQALTPDQTRSIAMRLISNEDDRARVEESLRRHLDGCAVQSGQAQAGRHACRGFARAQGMFDGQAFRGQVRRHPQHADLAVRLEHDAAG